MADGPSVESQIWSYVQGAYPGQVQVLGPDVMTSGANGNTLRQFSILAGGLSFPLLRDCADGSALADSNLLKLYVQRENYVVINKQGIIRYHAADAYDYGNRLHVNEILGTIDSLVTHPTDAEGMPARAWSLAASPNPAHGLVTFVLANPTPAETPARVRVLDLSGRLVAELPPAVARSGFTRLFWDAKGAGGTPLPAGVYLVQADVRGQKLTRRVALTR
jgi:hypothetical protein